jgi:hypothetical protein
VASWFCVLCYPVVVPDKSAVLGLTFDLSTAMSLGKGDSPMSHVNTVLNNLQDWYGESFSEALGRSLSRVMQHAQERSIGVISADRQGQTSAEKLHARRSLLGDIKKQGFGYTHVLGVGQEEGGPSSEKSFLVIGRPGDDKGHLKGALKSLGQKYGQMGVMHKQFGDPSAKFVHTSQEHFGKEEDLGTFHANDSAAVFHTKLKGNRQFSYQKKEGMDVLYLEPRSFFVRRDVLHW